MSFYCVPRFRVSILPAFSPENRQIETDKLVSSGDHERFDFAQREDISRSPTPYTSSQLFFSLNKDGVKPCT